MPNFRYRALTERGELVDGTIVAPTEAEVGRRFDYLRLIPVGPIVEEKASRTSWFDVGLGKPRPEDVTTFTLDIALLLRAGARLDEALDLIASDADVGRLQTTIHAIRSGILAGESFGDSISRYPTLFPPIYVALVRVGEVSGALDKMLHVLAIERSRAETLRRKLADAVRYPAFVLFAAICVLIFFLAFVLPQFSAILRDFGAEIDPVAKIFVSLSDVLTEHRDGLAATTAVILTGALIVARQPRIRAAVGSWLRGLPLVRTVARFHAAVLFCRNLEILLVAGVSLAPALRILADLMATMGGSAIWTRVIDRVRHGGKLSGALAETNALPAMAVRMLRLGEETGQLPVLAGRVAEFYENKLQRSLDRVVGIMGPMAIIAVSAVIGGLIVSLMTTLLSITELVG